MASAQVKSCVLLAGLLASGPTTVVEPKPSRDHTERMLAAAGVRIARDGDRITVAAQDELELGALHVPGDPSSAAFHAAAAVLVPRSRIVIEGMGANWTRTGFFRILRRMGGVVVGPLEEPARRRARRGAGVRARRLPRPAASAPWSSPTRCRWRSTSCRWSRCSAASPRGRPWCAAPASCG